MIDKIKYKHMNQDELNEELLQVCEKGNLNIVKYLLTSPELTEHAYINYKNNNDGWNALTLTCEYGYLDIVKYLLTSSELKEHIDIHSKNSYGSNALILACSYGYLDIVQYLLTSPKLKENSDIHHKDNDGYNALMIACANRCFDIVQYLIIDMNIKIDKETMNWLQGNNEHKIVYQDALKLIESRDLYQKLSNYIDSDKINNKKIINIKI